MTSSLNIKDREASELACQVAQKAGTSITEAVKAALRTELKRLTDDQEATFRDLLAIGERYSRHPVTDPRSLEEMLYDDNGLPK